CRALPAHRHRTVAARLDGLWRQSSINRIHRRQSIQSLRQRDDGDGTDSGDRDLMRFHVVAAALRLLTATPAFTDDGWDATVTAAKGQTVYWNAWAGDERTNAFIAWVGSEVKKQFDVDVRQVKLSDTAEAVTRVLAEKAAGKHTGGSVDLIWINGPNFLSMKEQGLLFGPFVERLPN